MVWLCLHTRTMGFVIIAFVIYNKSVDIIYLVGEYRNPRLALSVIGEYLAHPAPYSYDEKLCY